MIDADSLTPEQKRMNTILDNYFSVSQLLRDDVNALLDTRADDDPVWRRSFIRSMAPLVEGFIYSFMSILHANPELSGDERRALDPDGRGRTIDRIKLCLEAAFEQFGIHPPPDFSHHGWECTQRMFRARDALMHPKAPKSLTFTDAEWERIWTGVRWITREIFRLPDMMQSKFGA